MATSNTSPACWRTRSGAGREGSLGPTCSVGEMEGHQCGSQHTRERVLVAGDFPAGGRRTIAPHLAHLEACARALARVPLSAYSPATRSVAAET